MARPRSKTPIPDDCPHELRCSACRQVKPRGEFPRHRGTRTTFSYTCSRCDRDAEVMRRMRRDIEANGLESFAKQTERDLELLAMRFRVASEYSE